MTGKIPDFVEDYRIAMEEGILTIDRCMAGEPDESDMKTLREMCDKHEASDSDEDHHLLTSLKDTSGLEAHLGPDCYVFDIAEAVVCRIYNDNEKRIKASGENKS